jgi:Ran GTPase-activating protein (RanGAP) involved in mRNA processing and transport
MLVLVLGHNQIKELGGASLGLMLRFNTSITDLDISANEIGDQGLKLLAECLPSNKVLRNLHLARNRIGAAGVKAEILKSTLYSNFYIANVIGP